MSSRDPDSRNEVLAQALEFAWLQQAKAILHTGIPGIIRTYDPQTRRAQVQPALNLITQDIDGTTASHVKHNLLNVPVLQPSNASYAFMVPIDTGATGWLMFSERGMTAFKLTGEVSDPEIRYFALEDAVFLPFDFGTTQITPAGDGATIQTADGETHIEVHTERVRIRRGTQYVELTDDHLDADITGDVNVTATGTIVMDATKVVVNGDFEVNGESVLNGSTAVNGAELEHNSRNVGASHIHAGVTPGAGTSGPPTT